MRVNDSIRSQAEPKYSADSKFRIVAASEAPASLSLQAVALQDHNGRGTAACHRRARMGEEMLLLISIQDGHVCGSVRYEYPKLLLVRDTAGGGGGDERFLFGANVHFPVTQRPEPEYQTLLLRAALERLSQVGVQHANLYLKPELGPASAVLREEGFLEVGYSGHGPSIEHFGWTGIPVCKVFSTKLPSSSDMFPNLARLVSSRVRTSADASSAPEPTAGWWDEAFLYSSFSGYPQMTQFLELIQSEDDRSILSAPCAGGDVLRLAKCGAAPERWGVDICARAVELSRLRCAYPHLDELNTYLLHGFDEYLAGRIGDKQIVERIAHLTAYLGQSSGHGCAHTERLVLEMKAAFEAAVHNPVIADWWVLVKLLAYELAPEGAALVRALQELAGQGETCLRCLATAPGYKPVVEPLPRDVQVECRQGDLSQPFDLGRSFDLVVSWEACLMFHSWGLDQPFLANLARHVAPGGRIVLTGIRGLDGRIPAELSRARELLVEWGFETTYTLLPVAGSSWLASGDAMTLPVLLGHRPMRQSRGLPEGA